MKKTVYSGINLAEYRNRRTTFNLSGWRFYAFVGGFVGTLALVMYPITIYPMLHVEEYSKYKTSQNGDCERRKFCMLHRISGVLHESQTLKRRIRLKCYISHWFLISHV